MKFGTDLVFSVSSLPMRSARVLGADDQICRRHRNQARQFAQSQKFTCGKCKSADGGLWWFEDGCGGHERHACHYGRRRRTIITKLAPSVVAALSNDGPCVKPKIVLHLRHMNRVVELAQDVRLFY